MCYEESKNITRSPVSFPSVLATQGAAYGREKSKKIKTIKTKMCQMSRVMCQVSGVTCHVTPNHMVSKNLAFAIVPIFQEVITTWPPFFLHCGGGGTVGHDPKLRILWYLFLIICFKCQNGNNINVSFSHHRKYGVCRWILN